MPTKKATPQRKPRHRENESFQAVESAYAAAMSLFTHQNWSRARDAFQSFLKQHGGDREFADIADRARTHLLACEHRLAPPPPEPRTAEEWLLAGVVYANQRRTDDAVAALDRALADGASPVRTYYVRAAALAAADRHEEALEDLARAIEIDPNIRFQSLLDPDFERLRETAGYVALVEPPRSHEPAVSEAEAEDEIEDIDDEDGEEDFNEIGDAEGEETDPQQPGD